MIKELGVGTFFTPLLPPPATYVYADSVAKFTACVCAAHGLHLLQGHRCNLLTVKRSDGSCLSEVFCEQHERLERREKQWRSEIMLQQL